MEVTPGYKQTEVGVIPADWRVEPIDQISTVGRGRVINHREIARSLSPRYPVYSSQTSNNGVMGYIDTFEFEGEYITWTTDGANAGTVFARNGRFNCTNVCGTIKLKSDNHIFVAKILGKIAPRHVSRHLGNPKLMNDVMKRVKIPIPPTKAEQEAIAEALNDADALIESLEQLIAKKGQLKQGAMQELLTGKKRLPGFEAKPGSKHTEVGVVPEDWAVATLAAVCSMKSGEGITSASIDQFSKYPCYGGNGLRGFTTRFTHDGRYALIGRVGALCGNVLGVEGEFFASEHAIVVTASARTDSRWLTFVLGEMRLNQYSESSAQPVLTVSKLLKLDVARPPSKDEQAAIAATLSDMDAEIAALEAKLAKARKLRQGMMQELLTGRIRLV